MDWPGVRSRRVWLPAMVAGGAAVIGCAALARGPFEAMLAGAIRLAWRQPFVLSEWLILVAVIVVLVRAGRGRAGPEAGRWGVGRSMALGLVLFGIYATHGETYAIGDVMPATYLPVAMIRGDGPFLDRFHPPGPPMPGDSMPYFCAWSRGHFVPRYPLGPALLAVPFVLPQVAVLDWFRPGWEGVGMYDATIPTLGRIAAGGIGALTGVALLHLLRGLGLGRVALATTLAATLASNLWNESSRAMWQHGPAALALSLSMLLLTRDGRRSRARLVLAGLATAAMPVMRPIDVLFAVAVFLGMARHRPRDLPWFLPFPVLLGGATIGFNFWFFGTIKGGYRDLDGGVGLWDAWSTRFSEGAAGTLFSPSRGLFVYSPWIVVALATLPATFARVRRWPILVWLLAALVPYFYLLSSYRVWWGGHSFGPRFWADTIPLFAVLLGFGLDWSRQRCRPVFWLFVATIAFALVLQLLGAASYPTTWDWDGFAPERLWAWRDSELAKCWRDARARHK